MFDIQMFGARRLRTGCAVLCALTAAAFTAGCGGGKTPQGETAEESPAEETAVQDTQVDEASDPSGQPEVEAADDPADNLWTESGKVETEYFSITFPESWSDAVIYHFYENTERDKCSLEVCERESAAAGAGGILFTVDLTPDYPEYLDMLPCDYLGTLTNESGKMYHVVVRYPSDVQFDETTEERYTELYRQIPQVMEGFAGSGSYTFEKGSSEAEEQS